MYMNIEQVASIQTKLMRNKDEILAKGLHLGNLSKIAQISNPKLSIEDELINITKDTIKTETHLFEVLEPNIQKIDFYLYLTIVNFEQKHMDQKKIDMKSLQEDFLNGWEFAITKAYKDAPKRGKLQSEIRETFIKNVENRVGTLIYDLSMGISSGDVEECFNDYIVKHIAWEQSKHII